MNTKRKNSYMIIYVFLDYIYFIKQLYYSASTNHEKNKIKKDLEIIEYYILMYLKQCIGTKDLNIFLNEFKSQYKNE